MLLARPSQADRAFTMIELIVTLAIASILAAAAVVTYSSNRGTVFAVEPRVALLALQTYEQTYYIQHSAFVSDPSVLGSVEDGLTYTTTSGTLPTAAGMVGVATGSVTVSPGLTRAAFALVTLDRGGTCFGLVSFPSDVSTTTFPDNRIKIANGDANYANCTATKILSLYSTTAGSTW